MKSFLKYFLCSLVIVVPVFFVFKNVFSFSPLAGGDAPYFYNESLKELVTEPLSWTNRGNNFDGQNLSIWLAPLTFIYGLLGSTLNLGNNIAVRIVFYIPSIIMSVVGAYWFAKYLKFPTITSFFAALFYVLNTYFIILIDGGQVGVALAYSIFPFTLIFLKKLFDTPSVNYFYIALVALFVNGVADPRVTLISIITIFAWVIIESLSNKKIADLKKLLIFIPLILVWTFANLFWIYPLIKSGSGGVTSQNFNFTSLLSSLFIFQPHFPANQFGKIVSPPFYFVILPILIFANLFFKERKKTLAAFVFVVLVFMFVAKGGNLPLGGWYDFLVSKIPFGSSFRDSSKFFIPLVLFAGVLIGNTIDRLSQKFQSTTLRAVTLAFCFTVIVFLINPAFLGKMNFVLSTKVKTSDSLKIYQNINDQDVFFRTAYFSEHQPTSFESNNKPLIDGKSLVNLMPFRSMNAGEDVFNFANNPNYVEWFRVLGIKYIFLSGNPRDLSPSKDESEGWSETKNLVDSTPGLTKLNWGLSFPGYEVANPAPKMWAVDKLIGVVGPQGININKQLVPSVYFEDEKFDPRLLEGKSPDSLKIFFNGKEKKDLTMSFVKRFISPIPKVKTNEWATYKTDEYLKAKYELLIRGVEYMDFDYGVGVSFSTEVNEKMEIPLTATVSGEYVLGVRSMSATNSANLKISFNNINTEIVSKKKDFGWQTFGPYKLNKGAHNVVVQNLGGLQIVNAVALIPKESFTQAEKLADVFVKHFGEIGENQIKNHNFGEVKLETKGTLKSKFTVPSKGFWLISTESFNPLWTLRKGTEVFKSVPVYAMINGFYFEPNWNDVHIEYKGQEFVRWGIYASICSILLLSLIYFWRISKDGKN